EPKIPSSNYYALLSLTTACALLMSGYITARVVMVVRGSGYTRADVVMAVLLLTAELFLAMHAVGYFFNMIKCARRQTTLQPMVFAPHTTAPVALLVAAFNEQEHVLEATLSAAT